MHDKRLIAALFTAHLSSEEIRKLWLEGAGIVLSRRNEIKAYVRQLDGYAKGSPAGAPDK